MHVVCPRCGVELGLVEPLDREDVVHRPCTACWPHVTGRPLRFVYVAPDRPKLYRELVEEYRNDPTVLVLFDRRMSDRRRRPDRRGKERPAAKDRRGSAGDRRKRQLGIVVGRHGRKER